MFVLQFDHQSDIHCYLPQTEVPKVYDKVGTVEIKSSCRTQSNFMDVYEDGNFNS